MGMILAILSVPILAGTGIYNPKVMDQHGRCTAEPGSYRALYCGAAPQAPAIRRSHKKG
jgi:hypothetical protein